MLNIYRFNVISEAVCDFRGLMRVRAKAKELLQGARTQKSTVYTFTTMKTPNLLTFEIYLSKCIVFVSECHLAYCVFDEDVNLLLYHTLYTTVNALIKRNFLVLRYRHDVVKGF